MTNEAWPVLHEVVRGEFLLCDTCGKPGYYLKAGEHYHRTDEGQIECLNCLLRRQKKERQRQ